ncbi:hypothetical protein MXB_3258, partial [Myxobolus squamalis]
ILAPLVCDVNSEIGITKSENVKLVCSIENNDPSKIAATWCYKKSSTKCISLLSINGFEQSRINSKTGATPSDKTEFTLKFLAGPLTAGKYELKIDNNPKIKKQFTRTYPVIQYKDVEYDCPIIHSPFENPIIWKLNDVAITGIHFVHIVEGDKYSFKDDQFIEKYKLAIKSVDFSDSGTYSCTYGDGETLITSSFVLGVRGRFAPLWPAIGIIGECIVLAVIILIFKKSDS